MRIFTKNEANSSVKYYSDKIIGKPITDTEDTNPYVISSLEIVRLKEDEYVVKCIVRIAGNIIYKELENVIRDLNLLHLEEFLSNPDL